MRHKNIFLNINFIFLKDKFLKNLKNLKVAQLEMTFFFKKLSFGVEKITPKFF